MDSLLSNAQRCVRKADSLVKYGLFDEALGQLDKAIALLNELKSVTSCYDSIQMLNVQIDSIDRKMRSVAIKRSESIKKKAQIENLINRKRHDSIKTDQSKQHSTTNQSVLVENTNLNDCKLRYRHASKLNKDDKSIIEELSTKNGEFNKVNQFLINEIEQLKKENDFLKVELLKIHMSDSLNESSSDHANTSSISNSSSSILNSNASNSSDDVSSESLDTFRYNNTTPKNLNRNPSGLTMTSQTNLKSHNDNSNRIDLSKYINNDDDDSDAEAEHNIFSELLNNHNLNDSFTSASNLSLPPNEFIID